MAHCLTWGPACGWEALESTGAWVDGQDPTKGPSGLAPFILVHCT